MGVCVIDRGFKRNLTQLTSRYESILVHLYALLNRASINEPVSATCGWMAWSKQQLLRDLQVTAAFHVQEIFTKSISKAICNIKELCETLKS